LRVGKAEYFSVYLLVSAPSFRVDATYSTQLYHLLEIDVCGRLRLEVVGVKGLGRKPTDLSKKAFLDKFHKFLLIGRESILDEGIHKEMDPM